MAIGLAQILWLERVHRLGVFQGLSSVLEISPQDLMYPDLDALAGFVTAVTGEPCTGLQAGERFFDGKPHVTNATHESLAATRTLYGLLGLTDYASVDPYDIRADYFADLNNPKPLPRTFDVITQFGTIEHVFDVAGSMRFIHDHVRVGGIVLHVLPTRGDYNHGFYNFHSTWFRDVAAANHYEVLDLVNVPNVNRTTAFVDIRTDDDLSREAGFVRDAAAELDRPFSERASTADFIYAVLRKTSAARFVCPQQSAWATPGGGPIVSDNPAEHVAAGWEHFRARLWGQAGAEARAALQIAPDHPGVLHLHGAVALQQSFFNDAERLLSRAVAVAPKHGPALRDLGITLNALHRFRDAVAVFKQAAAAQPGMIEVYTHALGALAQVYQEAPEHPDVLRDCLWAYRGLAAAQRAIGNVPAVLEAEAEILNVEARLRAAGVNDVEPEPAARSILHRLRSRFRAA